MTWTKRWLRLLIISVCVWGTVTSVESNELKRMPHALPNEFNTMRPIRTPQKILVSVGQGEGNLQGKDDKVIQAAVDYVYRLGGGTVHVLPGIYTMHNAVFLRSGITLRGSGEKTIFRKAPSISSFIVREADWFEYAVQVVDSKGFRPGCGIAISNAKNEYPAVQLYTVTAIQGNNLYLDRRADKNFWMADQAKVQTLFSILHSLNADDVRVENIVLDGNRDKNDRLDDNFGGAVFLQNCNRSTFENVIAQNYNGDGFSFQVSDDIHFTNCQALNNADLGFHPGSGSQRPVFKNCMAKGNSQGLFFCWGISDGLAENCVFSENVKHGVNFGHRDTDNVIRNCITERNAEAGIIFRTEDELRTGDRSFIEGCMIRDNGEIGVDIQGKTRDITIAKCRFKNTQNSNQRIAIKIAPDAERITIEGNTFTHCSYEVLDQRSP